MIYEVSSSPSTLLVLATWLILILSNWVAWRRSRRRVALLSFLALVLPTTIVLALTLVDLGIADDDPSRFEGVEFPLFLIARMAPNSIFLGVALTTLVLLSCIPSISAKASASDGD